MALWPILRGIFYAFIQDWYIMNLSFLCSSPCCGVRSSAVPMVPAETNVLRHTKSQNQTSFNSFISFHQNEAPHFIKIISLNFFRFFFTILCSISYFHLIYLLKIIIIFTLVLFVLCLRRCFLSAVSFFRLCGVCVCSFKSWVFASNKQNHWYILPCENDGPRARFNIRDARRRRWFLWMKCCRRTTPLLYCKRNCWVKENSGKKKNEIKEMCHNVLTLA